MNVPVHAKAVVALIGSLLTFIVPWLLQVSTTLPPPWPALVSAVVALLTFFGVYKTPNQLTQEQVNHAVAKGNVSVGAIPPPATPWPTS
jgi:uncharacterized membrane protein YjfL (UPF0719 family)